ncbi:MAG: UbiA family prenyltransferase [Candidatus Parabeggiatoa sp.]|nr:UbiA family prenyltransferase [Candidatus Parabeggiatoa sp.]
MTANNLWKGVQALFIELFVYSSIWMAGVIASVTLYTQTVLLSKKVLLAAPLTSFDFNPVIAVFVEGVVIYTADHLRDLKKQETADVNNIHKRRLSFRKTWMKLLCVGGTCTLIYIFFISSWVVVALFLSHIFLGLLYAMPLSRLRFPHHPSINIHGATHLIPVQTGIQFRLKDIAFLKSFYVAACVTFMTVAAPIAFFSMGTTAIPWGAMLQLSLFIFTTSLIIENLQDCRDIRDDWKNGTKTLPVGMGIRRTKLFLIYVNALYSLVHLLLPLLPNVIPSLANVEVIELRAEMVIVTVFCSIAIVYFTFDTPRFLFSVLLETIYLLPIILFVLFTIMDISPFFPNPKYAPISLTSIWLVTVCFVSNIGLFIAYAASNRDVVHVPNITTGKQGTQVVFFFMFFTLAVGTIMLLVLMTQIIAQQKSITALAVCLTVIGFYSLWFALRRDRQSSR